MGCPGGSDAPAEAIPKFLPAECGRGSIIWLRLHGQIWKQHSDLESSVWSFHKNTCSSVGKSGDPVNSAFVFWESGARNSLFSALPPL